MIFKDQIINAARKVTEKHSEKDELERRVIRPTTLTKRFRDDGIVPNNPQLPLVIYRRAIKRGSKSESMAAVIDHLFAKNGWGRSWRASIYDFVHYHSQIHEVLGVAKGHAFVEFGGVKGAVLKVDAGDIAILPAGTGHRLINASQNFLVVGAYPEEGTYDECTDTRDRDHAIKRIANVKRPRTDPLFGSDGPLLRLWKRKVSRP